MTASSNRSGTGKGQRLAQRLSHILALLHQGDRIEKHDLARNFQVDVRTIERDLSERLYGIAERNEEGHWQLSYSARSTIPVTHLHRHARMTGTEELFPDPGLNYLLKQLETPERERAIHVQPTAYENLGPRSGLFSQLQEAIKSCKECSFVYKGKQRQIQPYRLIHKTGVWYLAAVDDGKLKNFSVALIESLKVDEASHFIPRRTHHDYINRKEDIWFTSETTEVTLRVASGIAHYFTRRDLLPRQQHRSEPDGSLIVTTHIGHMNQLLPVVRYWLPNIRILQPAAWHEAVMDSLRQTLKRWEPEDEKE